MYSRQLSSSMDLHCWWWDANHQNVVTTLVGCNRTGIDTNTVGVRYNYSNVDKSGGKCYDHHGMTVNLWKYKRLLFLGLTKHVVLSSNKPNVPYKNCVCLSHFLSLYIFLYLTCQLHKCSNVNSDEKKLPPPIQTWSVNNNNITAALKSNASGLYLLLRETTKYQRNKNTVHNVFIYLVSLPQAEAV